MKISLLYQTQEKETISDAIYNLSIDRCAQAFCPDSVRSDHFLYVLSHPLTNPENIVYRQSILNDFISHQKMFDELKTLFLRYDKIKADWVELRGSSHINSAGGSEIILEQTYASLKITSIFPRTIMSFFKAISDTLTSYEIKSDGLCFIRDYCLKILSDNSLEEIKRISGLFVYNDADDYDFDVIVKLSEDLKIIDCELSNICPKPNKRKLDKQSKQYKKQLKKIEDEQSNNEAVEKDNEKRDGILARIMSGFTIKSDAKSHLQSAIDHESFDTVIFILTEALTRIESTLTKITAEIYEIFHGLSSEMQFYDAAARYCEFVTSAGVPLCAPEILSIEQDTTVLCGLRDLFLISEGLKNEQIIPNDISLTPEIDGILVRGANNTGKTVFLRSIGTAQLFAQAGLPVCADKAVISVKNGIFSHFSSAEEDFTIGDTAGRFEGEVRCMAKIIEEIKPHALLLLNETFQTTAYNEGAKGMYDILSVFPRLRTKYIFVTHLLDLYEKFDPDRVLHMQTVLSSDESSYAPETHKKCFKLTKIALT